MSAMGSVAGFAGLGGREARMESDAEEGMAELGEVTEESWSFVRVS